MASHTQASVQTSGLSLRHGIRCVTQAGVPVEDVLLDVAERLGHENIMLASRMNKAVVIFLKEENLVDGLIESGISVSGTFVSVQPLVSITTKVTVSNVFRLLFLMQTLSESFLDLENLPVELEGFTWL